VRPLRGAWLLAALLIGSREAAAQAARDAEVFGEPAPTLGAGGSEGEIAVPEARSTTATTAAPLATDGTGGAQEPPSVSTPAAVAETAEDPLTIGGLFYLRAQLSALAAQQAKNWAFSSPSLADFYADVRPSDRVRGFALARVAYDPTLRPGSASDSTHASAASAGSRASGSPMLANAQRAELQVLLDQFWLRFDLARTVFVTAGKQHVRWGTARFWTPTDYLHATNRAPLDIFDARPGTSMLKVHLPIESLAWNFYGYALVESDRHAVTSIGRVAGALRSEVVLGAAELGLGVLGRRGESPRLAGDISAGVGPFDVYGELALRDGGEIDRVSFDGKAEIPAPPEPLGTEDPASAEAQRLAQVVQLSYPAYREQGFKAQAVVGATYTRPYHVGDVFTVAGEYFYNGLGYDDVAHYPGLILPRTRPLSSAATFFYLGRHYAALSLSLPRPFSLNLHSFTLSTVGNLSDRSFISRLDYSYVLNTYLTFEAFGAVHYGSRGGEFRLGVQKLRLAEIELDQAPGLFDLGIAVRLPI
jgi:hypothetical protein